MFIPSSQAAWPKPVPGKGGTTTSSSGRCKCWREKPIKCGEHVVEVHTFTKSQITMVTYLYVFKIVFTPTSTKLLINLNLKNTKMKSEF